MTITRPFSRLRNKIALLLIANAVALSVFCIPLWHVWTGTLLAGRIESLHVIAKRMDAVIEKRGIQVLAMEIDDFVHDDEAAFGILLLLEDPAGKRIAGNLLQAPETPPDEHGLYVIETEVGKRRPTVELIAQPLPDGYRLWVGKDMTKFNQLESIFSRGMLGITVINLLIALVAGWVLRRSMLDRIDMTTRTTKAIMEGDLSRRLRETNTGDEFDVLVRTVNTMLAQLDVLMQNVKHSSNAIAHDLRTPLAELRTDLEQLIMMRPPVHDMLTGIELAISDVDRVIAIFNALLRLAEIDSGTRRSEFKPVNVSTILEETAEFYLPVAEDKGVVLILSAEADLVVQGDWLLLTQAIGNLIDNALKYGGGSPVTLGAKRSQADTVEIFVADNGIGIPSSEKDAVVTRFYRLDQGRTTSGVGLGLALVNSVAKLHGGTLELRQNSPGLRVVITVTGLDNSLSSSRDIDSSSPS